jgi:hypothetical protein
MAWRSLFGAFHPLFVIRPAAVVSWIAIAAALAGCNPGAFDELADRSSGSGKRDASDDPDASRDAGAGLDAAADGGGSDTRPSVGTGGAGAGGQPGSSSGKGGAAAGDGAGGRGGAGGAAGGQDPGPAPCTHATDLARVTLTTSDVGELPEPAWIAQRSVAATALVRDRVLLVCPVPGAIPMAGWGSKQGLLSSPPHLEEQGPYVPLFDSSAVPVDRDPVIGSAVTDGDSALIYFADAHGWLIGAAGIARLQRNGNRAEVLRAAGALFPPPATGAAPWQPVFMNGALAVTEGEIDYVYVYGCQANPNNEDEKTGNVHESPCRIARVPRPDASLGESYRFWTGQEWGTDVSQAAIVMDHVASNFSVSYNAYLGKYLAVTSTIANSVAMRWAERPEGPWSVLGEFNTIKAPGGLLFTFNAIELPALRDACQRVTYVSYVNTVDVPQPDGKLLVDYSSHFVRVELR